MSLLVFGTYFIMELEFNLHPLGYNTLTTVIGWLVLMFLLLIRCCCTIILQHYNSWTLMCTSVECTIAMMFVSRLRAKIARTVLCCFMYNSRAPCT